MINNKINHRIKAFILLVFVLIVINPSPSQTQEWIVFTSGKYIRCLADEGQYLWVGTWGGGLVKLNKSTGEIIVYDKWNSKLPDNYVNAIAIDGQGNKWIGTGGGLAVYREGGVILPVEEKETNEIPTKFTLYQNYPNPFNPSTTIEFDIPEKTNVKLVVYDILGREVETLIDKELEPGRYKLNFTATNLPSGVYFYTLKTSKFTKTNKMLLIK
jgi:hypothetical protein